MKKLRFIGLALVVCLSISCAANKMADNRPRFQEAAAANVAMQFNSWDYIYITHPEYRDQGFLRQLKREDLGPAFARLGVGHDLAVVKMGWHYDPVIMTRLIKDWKALLSADGFRRVVFVQADSEMDVNGAVILSDSKSSSVGPTASR